MRRLFLSPEDNAPVTRPSTCAKRSPILSFRSPDVSGFSPSKSGASRLSSSEEVSTSSAVSLSFSSASSQNKRRRAASQESNPSYTSFIRSLSDSLKSLKTCSSSSSSVAPTSREDTALSSARTLPSIRINTNAYKATIIVLPIGQTFSCKVAKSPPKNKTSANSVKSKLIRDPRAGRAQAYIHSHFRCPKIQLLPPECSFVNYSLLQARNHC